VGAAPFAFAWKRGSARAALAVVVAAFASLAYPFPAQAADPGVVSDLNWGISAEDQERTAALLDTMGARWVRIHISWSDFEPSKGSYNEWNLNATGRAIAQARGAGANVVVMVHKAPAWASGSTSSNVPRNPADFAAFMAFLAGYYKGQVGAYEIWNEQNYVRFWSTGPDPTAYTALLKAAYPAVKAGDPAALVVFGGLSTNDYDFVDGAYRAGAKGFFDVMATHPYTDCGTAAPERIARRSDGRMTRGSFPAYREVRATMLAHGDAKPIWFTEFGWNTSTAVCDPARGIWQGGVSEAVQADYLARAFDFLAQDPYVEVAVWYSFRNNFWALDADRAEARTGLLRTDFSPKPAYDAFVDYAGSTAPPEDGAPSVSLTSPLDGARFRNSLTMSAEARDDAGVASVEFRVDGTPVALVSAAPYTFVWQVPRELSYGVHTVEARVLDVQGLEAFDSVSVVRVRKRTHTRLASRLHSSTRLVARTTSRSYRRVSRLVTGRVRGGVTSGRVVLDVQRYRASTRSWGEYKRRNAVVGPRGRYARILRLPRGERFRVRAHFRGTVDCAPSSSRRVYFRTPS
jgi:polysaccharide biosynthesis protein PslG